MELELGEVDRAADERRERANIIAQALFQVAADNFIISRNDVTDLLSVLEHQFIGYKHERTIKLIRRMRKFQEMMDKGVGKDVQTL